MWRRAWLAAALACMLVAFPQQAHATFRDAADSFPAAQELGSYGAPIYGDQLPDGTYKVSARTTSRMCIMYTDPADAEARDSKEQAVISVSGGSITAVFYISKAYTHLYMGTQEEAAASTNEDGTDASAYIAGDPDEGYVPHLFYMSVPALNVPMTVSTFSGGDRGVEAGKWYTREVVFSMTDDELQAIVSGAQDEPAEADGSGSDGAGDQVGDAGQGGFGTDAEGDAGQEIAEEAQEEEVAPAEPEPADPAALRGVRMNGATAQLAATSVDVRADAPEAAAPSVSTPQLLAGCVLALAFAAGLAARSALFSRSYETGRGYKE